jgi:hypothetical protein
MVDRAVVLDATRVRDATGGTTTTHVARPGDLPCQWGAPTDEEARVVGGAVSGKALATLSLPYGTAPIAEGSRVRNPADPPGRLWTVVANRTPASNMAVQVRLVVREV